MQVRALLCRSLCVLQLCMLLFVVALCECDRMFCECLAQREPRKARAAGNAGPAIFMRLAAWLCTNMVCM
jgi:hypothetical protein